MKTLVYFTYLYIQSIMHIDIDQSGKGYQYHFNLTFIVKTKPILTYSSYRTRNDAQLNRDSFL